MFRYLSLVRFLLILLCGLLGWQSPLFCRFFLFCFFGGGTVTKSGCLAEIWWSVLSQNPGEVRLIVQEGFRFVHIPVVRMVKFKFLAQFLVDHLPHWIVTMLIICSSSYIILAMRLVLWTSPSNTRYSNRPKLGPDSLLTATATGTAAACN